MSRCSRESVYFQIQVWGDADTHPYRMHTYKLLHLCMTTPRRIACCILAGCTMHRGAYACILAGCTMHRGHMHVSLPDAPCTGAYAGILAGCTMHRYTYNLYVYAYKVCTPIVRYLISRLTIYIYTYIYLNLYIRVDLMHASKTQLPGIEPGTSCLRVRRVNH
jgi:hypothetical protein